MFTWTIERVLYIIRKGKMSLFITRAVIPTGHDKEKPPKGALSAQWHWPEHLSSNLPSGHSTIKSGGMMDNKEHQIIAYI